jgi:hypothetical protein
MHLVKAIRSNIPQGRHRRPAARLIGGIAVGAFVAIGGAAAGGQNPLKAPLPARSTIERAATEASRTPYQAYLPADCITGSNFCKFTSESVAPGRRLEIRRVACQGWHASDTPPNFVTIVQLQTAEGGYVSRIEFLETTYTRVGTNTVWSISETVATFIPANHRMRIDLNSASTGVGSYGCAISGDMVRLRAS